jgi:hypothetical protein
MRPVLYAGAIAPRKDRLLLNAGLVVVAQVLLLLLLLASCVLLRQ